ncbi:prolyl oligopeptidase family serine peptidase [Saprospiraceae bacterium]|nr:prolyl oligopeptidase family serine peptidase [Saprospiraceae bacterium]
MAKSTQNLDYPKTRKDSSVIDDYNGTKITDEYRWLEVDTSAEVKSWVTEQNKVSFGYLESIPYRDAIKERYEELFNYVKLSSPNKIGDYYFFSKNDGLQNQSVIYYQKGINGEAEVFLDPNAMSKDGTVFINLLGFSKDDKYVAYSQSSSGSDWQEIHVMEVATKKKMSDLLKWVKFSGANWYDGGFFYSRYPTPGDGLELSAKNEYHAVYYHKLGTDQSEDKKIFGNDTEPLIYHFCSVTESRDYLILYASTGTDGFETYYKDLKDDGPITLLFKGFKNKSSVIDNVGDHLLVTTDVGAPKYRLIDVDLNAPEQSSWKEIIPETNDLLEGVSTGGGYLWADYLKDVTTRIYRYDMDGSNKKEIELPGLGTANGFGGRKDDKEFFYSFTSFTIPNTIYKYDVKTGVSEEFFESDLKFNPSDYVEKQVFYTSKDGTKIPMFIVHKKGLVLDGNNPTYLYAYGGFNVNLTPSFSTSRIILLENGGVYAMPNLRGGGEYGEEWHKAGMLQNKQNVFDDFIAAGEYLIKEKYTSKEKLAIAGGSNGGLLVGAAMTQRPDLFEAAFPAVGVMDMLRYHKFTVGWGWVPEYGSSEDPEQFDNLLSYSPLHNLKEGVEYPATMITTADHDDRVVPAHSFKFGAKLQEVHKGDNPVILRIAVDAGHGAGKPTSKIIEEEADRWSFFFYNTNSPVKYMRG